MTTYADALEIVAAGRELETWRKARDNATSTLLSFQMSLATSVGGIIQNVVLSRNNNGGNIPDDAAVEGRHFVLRLIDAKVAELERKMRQVGGTP